MSFLAIGMLFIAALLHTLWNILLKGSRQKFIATWWAVAIGGLLCLPALIYVGLPPMRVLPAVLGSTTVEVLYFLILSYAYQDHDFSLIYPIARGTAPAFLAIWSLTLLGEPLTRGGLAGLGLIITGLVLIGASGLFGHQTDRLPWRGILLALAVALLISIYTAIDGSTVKHTDSLPYALSIFVLLPALVTPFVVWRFGWQPLTGEWAGHKARLLAIGVLGVVAYLFALGAYRISPVGYAGAIREMSVVLGALAGWRFLGEKFGGWRVAGAIVIFTGILAIAFWG